MSAQLQQKPSEITIADVNDWVEMRNRSIPGQDDFKGWVQDALSFSNTEARLFMQYLADATSVRNFNRRDTARMNLISMVFDKFMAEYEEQVTEWKREQL